MKYLILIIVILMSLHGRTQTVFESLISFEKSYAPLFGSESASLTITFLMKYDLDSPDTTFHVVVKVDQIKTEVAGYSLGTSLFSGNLLSGMASSYSYQKENGGIMMGYDEFLDLYSGVNRVFTYTTTTKNQKESKRNSLITYEANDIIFGGEYNPDLIEYNKVRYYLQVGDAVFTIRESEFEVIAARLRNIKDAWDRVRG